LAFYVGECMAADVMLQEKKRDLETVLILEEKGGGKKKYSEIE
jgi:hypothetical protein